MRGMCVPSQMLLMSSLSLSLIFHEIFSFLYMDILSTYKYRYVLSFSLSTTNSQKERVDISTYIVSNYVFVPELLCSPTDRFSLSAAARVTSVVSTVNDAKVAIKSPSHHLTPRCVRPSL